MKIYMGGAAIAGLLQKKFWLPGYVKVQSFPSCNAM